MRLLLDENLPKRLKLDFPTHDVYTVWERQWNGTKDGELLQLMLAGGFQALLTFDKNLQHQHNLDKYTLTVFVLNAPINTYAALTKLSAQTNTLLAAGNLPHGPIIIKGA